MKSQFLNRLQLNKIIVLAFFALLVSSKLWGDDDWKEKYRPLLVLEDDAKLEKELKEEKLSSEKLLELIGFLKEMKSVFAISNLGDHLEATLQKDVSLQVKSQLLREFLLAFSDEMPDLCFEILLKYHQFSDDAENQFINVISLMDESDRGLPLSKLCYEKISIKCNDLYFKYALKFAKTQKDWEGYFFDIPVFEDGEMLKHFNLELAYGVIDKYKDDLNMQSMILDIALTNNHLFAYHSEFNDIKNNKVLIEKLLDYLKNYDVIKNNIYDEIEKDLKANDDKRLKNYFAYLNHYHVSDFSKVGLKDDFKEKKEIFLTALKEKKVNATNIRKYMSSIIEIKYDPIRVLSHEALAEFRRLKVIYKAMLKKKKDGVEVLNDEVKYLKDNFMKVRKTINNTMIEKDIDGKLKELATFE